VTEDLKATSRETLSACEVEDEQHELDPVAEWRNRLRRLVASGPRFEQELADPQATSISSKTMKAKVMPGRVRLTGIRRSWIGELAPRCA
jgi:hypothetical protein